jgi:hypothetical protein
MFDKTNGSHVEQYDLDIVDDEEAPYEALQRMAIGDLRPQDSNEPLPQMILLHPHKVLIKIIMKKMFNQMIRAKKRAMIKREMKMVGIKEKHHHIYECVKIFKEIIPLTTYLVKLKKGNH